MHPDECNQTNINSASDCSGPAFPDVLTDGSITLSQTDDISSEGSLKPNAAVRIIDSLVGVPGQRLRLVAALRSMFTLGQLFSLRREHERAKTQDKERASNHAADRQRIEEQNDEIARLAQRHQDVLNELAKAWKQRDEHYTKAGELQDEVDKLKQAIGHISAANMALAGFTSTDDLVDG